MQNEVYTTEQLSKKLGVSNRAIQDNIREGKLKAYKKFRTWFVLHSDLIDFIKREGVSSTK